MIDKVLDVLREDGTWISVQLVDGTPMYVPRAWTTADGEDDAKQVDGELLTVTALKDLLRLVAALRERS